MRISKESIFTGLNNLKVLSIVEVQFDKAFGFTDREVRKMLQYYGLSDHYGKVQTFGEIERKMPKGGKAGSDIPNPFQA